MGKVIEFKKKEEKKPLFTQADISYELLFISDMIMSGRITEITGIVKIEGRYLLCGANEEGNLDDFKKLFKHKLKLLEKGE